MKNRNLSLILLFLIFCSYIKLEAKPRITTYVYINGAYGIIENKKVNRMGFPKEDIDQIGQAVRTASPFPPLHRPGGAAGHGVGTFGTDSGQYLSLYPRTPYHGLCSAENPYPGMYGAASWTRAGDKAPGRA